MKKRIHWIDVVKGIAIILMVTIHVVSTYHESGLYRDNVFFNFSNTMVYSFIMPLFMMISGYVLSKGKRRGTKGQQVVQKLINYGIPYVVFSLVWVLAKMSMAGHTNNPLTLKDLLWIPIIPTGFMWFLYALMIMQIIQVFITTDSKVFKAIHLLAALAGYLTLPYLNKAFAGTPYADCILIDFLKTYLFFLIGVYLLDFVLQALERYHIAAFAISGVLMVTGNILIYNGVMDLAGFAAIFLGLIGSLFMIELSMLIDHNAFFEYLGRQTLPIYVLHGISVAGARMLLTRLHLNILYGVVPYVVCTAAGIIFPLCVYWISTKIWKLDAIFYPGKYLKVCKKSNG